MTHFDMPVTDNSPFLGDKQEPGPQKIHRGPWSPWPGVPWSHKAAWPNFLRVGASFQIKVGVPFEFILLFIKNRYVNTVKYMKSQSAL